MDLDNIWQKYCQRNLHSVAMHIYLLFDRAARNQLVLPNWLATDLKKRRAQELTAANCIVPDLCEKIVVSVPVLAVDLIFFIDEKNFTVAPPVN